MDTVYEFISRYDDNTHIWVQDQEERTYYEGSIAEAICTDIYDDVLDMQVIDWYFTNSGDIWITVAPSVF